MRPQHRLVNNVGYTKIYPMSSTADDTFCHYCGRKASMLNGLSWDHVPALNVKVPKEFIAGIRKTLIRACVECNNMASDIAHIDYAERHLWLKTKYLQKYKKLILSEGGGSDPEKFSGFLKAYVSNQKKLYVEILGAIGFGIQSIDQIESEILNLRNSSRKLVGTVLIDYLYGTPEDDQEELEEVSITLRSEVSRDEEPYEYMDEYDFILFLSAEMEAGNIIKNQVDYLEWKDHHESRFTLLDLPLEPESHYETPWSVLAKLAQQNFGWDQESNRSGEYEELISLLAELMSEGYPVISLEDYLEIKRTPPAKFKPLIREVMREDPENYYGVSWDELSEHVIKKSHENFISVDLDAFLNILNSKKHGLSSVNCGMSYCEWVSNHRNTFKYLKLPVCPEFAYELTWAKINELTDKLALDNG